MKNYLHIEEINGIKFHRIGNDINGNPRYVFHFRELLGNSEYSGMEVLEAYEVARKRANRIGAKVYRANWYGGGFVIISYNLYYTAESIIKERKV